MAKGSGTILHDLIADWTGAAPSLSCRCRAFINRMNDIEGWAESNVEVIAAHLVKEARRQPLQWQVVPMDSSTGRLLNALVNRAWKAAMFVPGAGLTLELFVRSMVEKAIRLSKEE